MPDLSKDRLQLLFVLLFPAVVILLATSYVGIGYGTDAVRYRDAGVGLFEDGLTSKSGALVHFPPLLPMTFVAFGFNDTLMVLFNAVLLVIVLYFMLVVLRYARVDKGLARTLTLAIGVSPTLLVLYAEVRSEALYLVLTLGIILSLLDERYLIATALAAASALDRYAGVTLIALVVLVIWYQRGIIPAILHGALAISPLALWMLRNSLVQDNPGRQLSLHLISNDHLSEGAATYAGWFLPITIVAIYVFISVRRRIQNIPPVIVLSALYIAIYVPFLLVSISLFDYATRLNTRILSPAFLLGWLIFAYYISINLKYLRKPSRTIVTALFKVILILNILFGLFTAALNSQTGFGLEGGMRDIYIETVAEIPAEITIYTNHETFLSFAGREGITVPQYQNLEGTEKNPNYASEMTKIEGELANGEAVIVWFAEFTKSYLVSLDELKSYLPYQQYDNMYIFGREIEGESS